MEDRSSSLKRRLWLDIAMLALAVFSVLLLLIELFWPDLFFEQQLQTWVLTRVDWCICAAFFGEFILRLARSSRRGAFVRKNWYDILGMIPFSHPALRSFRLLRIVRVVGTVMRLRRGLDRAFGEGFAGRLVGRYKDIIVEVVSDAVIVRVLSVVKTVVEKGRYRDSLKKVLESNRETIAALVKENLDRSRTLAKFGRIPFVSQIEDFLIEEVSNIVFGVVSSDQLEQIIRQIIDAVMVSIMEEVAKREAA